METYVFGAEMAIDNKELGNRLEKWVRERMNEGTVDTYAPYRQQFIKFCKERGYEINSPDARFFVAEFLTLKADGIKTHAVNAHHRSLGWLP
jgi:hypothetical protein